MPASDRYATFFVSNWFFGVDVLRVQEVLSSQPMTRVPLAPSVIEGLINLRGQIVPAVDMRRRLGMPARSDGQLAMNMVIRNEEGAFSLLVDEIGDVVDVDASAYELPPVNLDATAREIVRGIYKLNDRLLLVLDADRAADLSNGKST
jgi:purine-binding chemotaxis protein CheW